MLPNLMLPASWRALLETFRPAFSRAPTFGLFMLLATGLVTQTSRRTVVGMLAGAGMATVVSFHSACRFFSQHRWAPDRLGLLLARLIVARLLPTDAPLVIAIDDTLLRRWGRKVHAAFWTHDGAAQGPAKLGRGNRWIIAGIVVQLRFCSRPVCLPVLCRLWAGKGTTTPVELAGQLLGLLAETFPDRQVHGVGDAAYHGRALLVPDTSFTTRLPTNAALYDLAPPRTGKRGRPRLKGRKLGKPSDLAKTASWRTAQVRRYGRTETVHIAEVSCLWYGAFAGTSGRLILVRESDSLPERGYDLALFTTDTHAPAKDILARYAQRWSIESVNATAKQLLGVGQARNRVRLAVERTVPFGLLIQSLVTVWYACYGYHPEDITARHTAQPWYPHKADPTFEDMLTKLRRAIIASRFTITTPVKPDQRIIRDYALACAAAAA